MLTITQQAGELLSESRQTAGAPDSYGVRIFVATPPGEESASIAIAFVPEAEPGDQVSEQEGVTAYIAPELVEALDDATLDASGSDAGRELVLSR